jgi:molecular chaperone DnaJ
MKDYYEILGLSNTENIEDIKKAYRTEAKKHHPDLNQSDTGSTDRFKKIQEAYDTLSDPIKKSIYDSKNTMHFRHRKSKPADNSQQDFSFQEVMDGFFNGTAHIGRNVSLKIEIGYKDVLLGCIRNILIRKKLRCVSCHGFGAEEFENCDFCMGTGTMKIADVPFEITTACQKCSGSGKMISVKCAKCGGSGFTPDYFNNQLKVFIPPGAENGSTFRVAGEGEESRKGGSFGDLIIFVTVKKHDIFHKEGANLHVDVPVSYTQLVLGDEIEIPTLNDDFVKVKIPKGSQTHTKFRLKGKGVFYNGVIGDLIATLKIETPKSLNDNHRKILEQLAKIEQSNVTPKREHWSKKIHRNNK